LKTSLLGTTCMRPPRSGLSRAGLLHVERESCARVLRLRLAACRGLAHLRTSPVVVAASVIGRRPDLQPMRPIDVSQGGHCGASTRFGARYKSAPVTEVREQGGAHGNGAHPTGSRGGNDYHGRYFAETVVAPVASRGQTNAPRSKVTRHPADPSAPTNTMRA
jgi:hypothetical protein